MSEAYRYPMPSSPYPMLHAEIPPHLLQRASLDTAVVQHDVAMPKAILYTLLPFDGISPHVVNIRPVRKS